MKEQGDLSKYKSGKVSSMLHIPLMMVIGALICFGALITLAKLSTSKLERFDENATFEELSKIKEATLPKYLRWLYSDALSEREARLDQILLDQTIESYLNLVISLKRTPLKIDPLMLFSSSERFRELKARTSTMDTWLKTGQWTLALTLSLEREITRGKSLLNALESWVNLSTQHKPKRLISDEEQLIGGQGALLLSTYAQQNTRLKASLTLEKQALEAFEQYTFAWYRHWTEEAMELFSSEPSELLSKKPQPELLIDRIINLGTLSRNSQTLSSELSAVIYFKILRASERHWTSLWRITETQIRLSKDEKLSLKYLSDFKVNLDKISKSLKSSSSSEEDPTRIPENVKNAWLSALISISDITFAEGLLSQGYDQKSQRQDYAKVWFIPLLSELRLQRIEIELKGVKLRTLMKHSLSLNPLTDQALKELKAQAKALGDMNQSEEKWTQRLNQIEKLFEDGWRTLRGFITCDEESLDVDPSWRDLGPLDKLSPSLYVVSSTDKALLSQRKGRLKWSIERHKDFKIRVYDEDRLSDPDLLFIEPMPSILEMILAKEQSRHGCRYRVELLDQEALAEWLSD